MQIRDLMTNHPACCTPDTPLEEVAGMMLDNDCGMIPIVAGDNTNRPVGTVTDRDIVLRAVAAGENPLDLSANEVMTGNPITIDQNASHQEAMNLIENHQIRRLLVIDDNGECVGVLSQADLAIETSEEEVGEVVQHVSQPTGGMGARP